MTLDEAIKHCEEVAEEKENEGELLCQSESASIGCLACADEHRQLAEWLKELKESRVVLDKIKAEIEALPKTYPFVNHIDMYVKVSDVTKIIDKYKESEVE